MQKDPSSRGLGDVFGEVQFGIGGAERGPARRQDPFRCEAVEFTLEIQVRRAPLAIAKERFLISYSQNNAHECKPALILPLRFPGPEFGQRPGQIK